MPAPGDRCSDWEWTRHSADGFAWWLSRTRHHAGKTVEASRSRDAKHKGAAQENSVSCAECETHECPRLSALHFATVAFLRALCLTNGSGNRCDCSRARHVLTRMRSDRAHESQARVNSRSPCRNLPG